MWICGQCLHEFIQRQEKLKREAFLEGWDEKVFNMILIDPVTRQRISYQKYCGDLEYDVIGGSSISTQVVSKQIDGITGMDQINLGQSIDRGITGENKQTTKRVQIRRRVNFGND